MGCCSSIIKTDENSEKDALDGHRVVSTKQSSSSSLGPSNKDTLESPTLGFKVSEPENETPFESLCKQSTVPGSSTSLDELCGQRKVDTVSTSEINAGNNNLGTATEDDVNIDIYPMEQAVDTEEEEEEEEEEDDEDGDADIDIYPLDQEHHQGTSLSVEHVERDGQQVLSRGEHNEHYSLEQLFANVFLGDVSSTVPNLAKIVRIFINSSSTDSRVERTALMKHVYPKLRRLCQENGYDFHIKDMSWGVQDAAVDDHMTTDVCLRELRSSVNMSTGPTFVTFLGQKYGYRVFPPKIPATDFEALRAAVEDEEDIELIDQWFKRDDNAIPPEYVLQPISSQFPVPDWTSERDAQEQARKELWDVFLTLQHALKSAAKKALDKKLARKYFISVTEHEIDYLIESKASKRNAFWFKRNITDLKENIKNEISEGYVDIMEVSRRKWGGRKVVKQVDKSAQNMLKVLKDKALPQSVDKANIRTYNVKWCDAGGLNPEESPEHAQYIDTLCKDFHQEMRKSITNAIKDRVTSELADRDFEEIARHTLVCQRKSASFYGREVILQQIEDHVTSSASTPLVICGAPGCGTSSLLAMAAKLARSWIGNEAVVVVRFLGTTPDSSTMYLVIRSVCVQLAKVFGVEIKTLPKDLHDVATKLHELLQMATEPKPILLFMDSLNQLHRLEEADEVLSWLPRQLPPNVHVVLSTFYHEGSFSGPVRNLISDNSELIEVPDVSDKAAANILAAWLTSENRRLAEHQEQIVLQAFSQCRLPLYLKLAFQQAVQWKSYTPVEETKLGASIGEVINALFESLEKRHGKVLVQYALSYITLSKDGISEPELEDILSCNEQVLEEVFRRWVPPIRRLPPVLWSRIRTSIDSYLAERQIDGVSLMTWRYRQFHEVASERYLQPNSDDVATRLHSELADYFDGRWTEGARKADVSGVAKERYVASQPLHFKDGVLNTRKLNELPYHLAHAKDFDRLKRLALCNFEFLQARLEASSIHHLLGDFSDALSIKDDKDIALVGETLRLSVDALNLSPRELASQLIGRLSSPRSPSPTVARLLRQAHHPSIPALIPNIPCLGRPGKQLIHAFPGVRGCVALSGDGRRALSGSCDKSVKLWDVRNGHVLKTIEFSREVTSVSFACGGDVAVVSCQDGAQVWNLSTGVMEWETPGSDSPLIIAVAGEELSTLLVVKEDLMCLFSLPDGKPLRKFYDESYVHNRVAALGSIVVFANSGCGYVRKYNITDIKYKRHIPDQDATNTFDAYGKDSDDTVSSLFLSPFNNGQIITFSQKSLTVRVLELESGKCLHVLGPNIMSPAVTADGRHMLCANSSHDISVWSLVKGVKERHVTKHPPMATITQIASVDLKLVITVSDSDLVRVWDLERRGGVEENFEDNDSANSIQQLLMIKSNVQKQAITKSKTDGPICVWNLSSCQVIRTLNGTCADEIFVVDDTRAVIRSGTKLALVNLEKGELIKKMRSEFTAKTDRVQRRASSLYKRRDLAIRLAESPRDVPLTKSREFSDCALAGSTHVLILSRDRLYLKLASLETGDPVAKLKAGQTAIIETVLVSGNGVVAVCACEKAPMLVWNLKQRTRRHTLHFGAHFPQLSTADISYDGRYLADVVKLHKTHKSVVTWDLEEGKVKHVIGQGENVWSVALSAVSMRMVVADETLRVYDVNTGEFLQELDGHTEPVKGVSLSMDGARALTYVPQGSRERTIRLWDLMSGTCIATFTPDMPVSHCVISDDGEQVVMVINKSRPIVSLALTHEIGSRELSVDVTNAYLSHPSLHGAVYDMKAALDWDTDDENDADI